MRDTSKHVLELLPGASEFARRWEEHMKGMVMPGTLFEELGFNYIGPVDGHDLPALMATLRNMHDLQGCRLLHVITQKGRGYSPAERDPCNYHGVKPFDLDSAPATVVSPTATTSAAPQSYSDVFGDWVCDMANIDERLLAITPAMCEGSGLTRFRDEFPDRYFDVGIAEQHAVTFAAGLACENYKPVVAIYSTFLQRAYDQLVHDVALQNLDVTFAIDRAGLVGADGATHAGTLDISFMRCIPNLILMAPSDQNECRRMLATAYLHQGPAAVRYPRGAGPVAEVDEGLTPLPLGRARVRRRGTKAALLVFGTLLDEALQAAEVMDVTVVDMRFIKPLDKDCIVGMAESHEVLVTVEDNVIAGGAGAAVSECLSDRQVVCPVFHLGLPDRFIAHATREQQLRECGIDAGGIEARLRDILGRVTNHVIAGDVMDPDRFWSS
jgi:1-deoxy-D-xylulose-5-phosphate synthase